MQPPAPPAPEEPAPKKKKFSSKTVAYAQPPAPPAPEEPAPKKKKFSSKTVAYVPSADDAGARADAEVAVGDAAPDAVTGTETDAASVPLAAPSDDALRAELLSHRDEDPTGETPLYYRERNLVVPEGTPRGQAERVAWAWFEDLRGALAEHPDAKFFCVSVFDYHWDDRPERPPLVTLQWKDWRGEPQVQFPEVAPTPRPRRISRPPAERAAQGGDDPRLVQAFDACHDMLFLTSPEALVRFAVRLLTELVPSEASAGLVMGADGGTLQVVATAGGGADAFHGRTLSPRDGLCAPAASGCLRVDDVAADGRFLPEQEGRPGLTARNALYTPLRRRGQLVGMLQLLNRTGAPAFSEADEAVVAYVAQATTEALP